MTPIPIKRGYNSITLVSISCEKDETIFNFLRAILPLQQEIYRGRERFELLEKIKNNLENFFVDNFSGTSLKQLIELNLELKRQYSENSPAWGKFWDYLQCLILKHGSDDGKVIEPDSLNVAMQKLQLLYWYIERLCLVLEFDCHLGGDISIEFSCDHIVIKTIFKNNRIVDCIQSFEDRYHDWFLCHQHFGIKTLDNYANMPGYNQFLIQGWMNEWRFLHDGRSGKYYLLSFYIGEENIKEKVDFVMLLSQVLSKYLSKESNKVENYLGIRRMEFQVILFAIYYYLLNKFNSLEGKSPSIIVKKSDFAQQVALLCENYVQISDVSDLFKAEKLQFENNRALSYDEILHNLYYGLGASRKKILTEIEKRRLRKESVFFPFRRGEHKRVDERYNKVLEMPLKRIDFDWYELIEKLLTKNFVTLSYKHNKRFIDIIKENVYLVIELPDDQLAIPFVSEKWLKKDMSNYLEVFVEELEKGGLIGQVKGTLFERIIESSLRRYNSKMVFYPITENKVDLVFGASPFLFAIECKYRYFGEKIRTGKGIKNRWKEIKRWLMQSDKWAHYVARMFPEIIPREARDKFLAIVPVVLTFQPEFLMDLSDRYTLDGQCPRVCTVDEFLEFINRIDAIELMTKPYIIRIRNNDETSASERE